jgi:hypothetical protein
MKIFFTRRSSEIEVDVTGSGKLSRFFKSFDLARPAK